jgi:hypothetical protein
MMPRVAFDTFAVEVPCGCREDTHVATDSQSPEPTPSGKPGAWVWALRVVSFGALMKYEWIR